MKPNETQRITYNNRYYRVYLFRLIYFFFFRSRRRPGRRPPTRQRTRRRRRRRGKMPKSFFFFCFCFFFFFCVFFFHFLVIEKKTLTKRQSTLFAVTADESADERERESQCPVAALSIVGAWSKEKKWKKTKKNVKKRTKKQNCRCCFSGGIFFSLFPSRTGGCVF